MSEPELKRSTTDQYLLRVREIALAQSGGAGVIGHRARAGTGEASVGPVEQGPRLPAGAVLVVDDDPSILAMLCALLHDEGYRVVGARDGMEALAEIEREIPFVILLDVHMPMLDGGNFAKLLRGRGLRVPIVVVTASDAPAWRREIGADAYVAKPFDLPDLLATVALFRDLASGRPVVARSLLAS